MWLQFLKGTLFGTNGDLILIDSVSLLYHSFTILKIYVSNFVHTFFNASTCTVGLETVRLELGL